LKGHGFSRAVASGENCGLQPGKAYPCWTRGAEERVWELADTSKRRHPEAR